jgi:hypothetical protein
MLVGGLLGAAIDSLIRDRFGTTPVAASDAAIRLKCGDLGRLEAQYDQAHMPEGQQFGGAKFAYSAAASACVYKETVISGNVLYISISDLLTGEVLASEIMGGPTSLPDVLAFSKAERRLFGPDEAERLGLRGFAF